MGTQRRVVCAANLYTSGKTLISARHWDVGMCEQYNSMRLTETEDKCTQGFIDQWGVFMSRTEAWKVAEAAGQILYRCGGDDADGGTLYSENLY